MGKHINIVYKETYKMQRLVELKDFDSFLLERKENSAKMDTFIEKAVSQVLQDGCRTADIKSPSEVSFLTGSEMTEKILSKLKEL